MTLRPLDAAAVAALLPHRPPFLFVDEATHLVPGERVEAVWRVPRDAFFVAAHFPGNPLVPGTILAEALAQAAALVWLSEPEAEGLPMLVGLDRVRFRAAVRPGDTVTLRAEAATRRRIWQFRVEATVGDTTVCDGTILAVRG